MFLFLPAALSKWRFKGCPKKTYVRQKSNNIHIRHDIYIYIYSLPEFLDLKIFGKNILVVNTQFTLVLLHPLRT